jgi:hypothetical protein
MQIFAFEEHLYQVVNPEFAFFFNTFIVQGRKKLEEETKNLNIIAATTCF